ncbi:hypothetical protein CONLIGDRAFT_685935 [Coniochaeta ligniaria NRRL 30616]|uniref:Uncharacterized protein n=1 Tax=Coniochaeta ligniaria NRRL 30616 TaxID=1408157 RepID=A0A1J7IA36_9PEZI|nr:hypothetical protein CONLIGDRAFT_685935 [Coniochaeta ligniaria NRRL 30616]
MSPTAQLHNNQPLRPARGIIVAQDYAIELFLPATTINYQRHREKRSGIKKGEDKESEEGAGRARPRRTPSREEDIFKPTHKTEDIFTRDNPFHCGCGTNKVVVYAFKNTQRSKVKEGDWPRANQG